MTRDTKVQLAASVVMVVSLLSSSVLATRLTGLAGRHRLTYTERAEEGQPWEVAAGIAMGAFRGIFVNWLWIRANNLKEEGKFYEANELAKVITRLQPRFPRVWVFHAWNMAYNISVATHTPEERWEWVNRGLSLLRDEAIPANPNDLLLHKELAWIYLHKIAGITDDANGFYKRKFAEEWTIVLGSPPARDVRDRSRKVAIDRCADWLSKISDAPDHLEEVVAAEPSVAMLVERLGGVEKVRERGVRLLGSYEFSHAMSRSARRSLYEKGMGEKVKQFNELVNDREMSKAWEALLAHVRKRVLVDQYHMEPERMVRYTRLYGPIDWRHPAAHSLYWSARGVELAMARFRGEMDRPDYDFLNTDRVTVQSIQQLFRAGDVYFDFLASVTGQPTQYLDLPNVHFIQAYADVLDSMFDPWRAGKFNDRGERLFTMLWHGYENFVREAVTYLYRRGQVQEAEGWITKLRTDKRRNKINPIGGGSADFELPIEEFVEKELRGEATRPDIAKAQVTGSLMAAYASGLLVGDNELFSRQFNFAQRMHRYFMEEQLRNTPAGGEIKRMAGELDPDFEIVAGQTFIAFISQLSLDDCETAYLNAPDKLQALAFDALRATDLAAQLDEEARAGGRPFRKVFPPPAIYEGYIADIRARLDARRAATPEIQKQ